VGYRTEQLPGKYWSMDISRISVTKTVFVDVFSWYCFRNPGNPID